MFLIMFLPNCLQIKDLDEERRKREHDTAQGDDITYCLEKDRTNLKQVRPWEQQQLDLGRIHSGSVHSD